jgi:GrpB-like predicted nucleotidyltransferase (UPF0157 family)
MPMDVHVVPHDPAWQHAFTAEAERIAHALGEPHVRVHHIGSTAIPGIAAKPVIDILLEVDVIDRLDRQRADMQALSYEALGEFGIQGRRYFRKNTATGIRTHHVHGFRTGSAEAVRHLAFRAYLVAHPDESQAYGALKEALAMQHPNDMPAYMDGKDVFIKERVRRALVWWETKQSGTTVEL